MQSYSFIYLFLINVALLVLVLPTAQSELIQFLSHVVNTPWSVFKPLFLSQTWHLKGRRCRLAQLCQVIPAPDRHQAQGFAWFQFLLVALQGLVASKHKIRGEIGEWLCVRLAQPQINNSHWRCRCGTKFHIPKWTTELRRAGWAPLFGHRTTSTWALPAWQQQAANFSQGLAQALAPSWIE